MLDGRVYQLTWKHPFAFIYDYPELTLRGRLPYQYEGWGLSRAGDRLLATDGSSKMRILDSELNQLEERDARLGPFPLNGLNDIEVVDGVVYCNAIFDSFVYAVDFVTGMVSHILDCHELERECMGGVLENVMNGIAYDATENVLFVTGKRWPWIYELDLPE